MLKKIDDILFCYPNDKSCKTNIKDAIKNIKQSSKKMKFDAINIDKMTIFMSGFIFLAINIYFLSGFINYKKVSLKLKQKQNELSKYHLPLTQIQLNAIYSKLKKIDSLQQIIRKDLEFFSKTPLNKNEEYKILSFENKFYYIKIKTSKNLHNFFSKRFIIKSEEFNKTSYQTKLTHE